MLIPQQLVEPQRQWAVLTATPVALFPQEHRNSWEKEGFKFRKVPVPLSAVSAEFHLRNWNWISLDQFSPVESFEVQDV